MRLPWKHHPMNPDRIKPPPPPVYEEPWRMNLIPMPKKKTEEEGPNDATNHAEQGEDNA